MITINGKQAKICIDPGHGGSDPGAVGPTGLHEADVCLKISKKLMLKLHEMGVDSRLTRTENVGLQLSERVKDSKDSNCFISIHCNAHNSMASGIETVYSKKGGLHKALANYVQQAMMKAFKGSKDRGLKMSPSMEYPRSLYVLSASVVPSCLVEVEFISHPDQEKSLATDERLDQIAQALSLGLKSYLMSLQGVKEDGLKLQLAETSVDKKGMGSV